MFTKNFVDLSVVRLKDGRRGTVVHVYPEDVAAIVELEDTNELIDVEPNEIAAVEWRPGNN